MADSLFFFIDFSKAVYNMGHWKSLGYKVGLGKNPFKQPHEWYVRVMDKVPGG